MKNNNPFLSIFIFFLIISFLFLLAGVIYWNNQNEPVSQNKIKVNFIILKGESISSIGQKLADSRFIKNPFLFKMYVKINKLEKKIQAGSFSLSPSLKMTEIAESLTKGSFDAWVTLPEGLRKEEIAELLSLNFKINKKEFIENSREGYLFPDTYLIPKNYSVPEIIKLMEDNWKEKISNLIRQPTEKELILASIIEREALHDVDRPLISGIFQNRINNGWALEADATVQYALGFQVSSKKWWKKNLTLDDLNYNSPYNTRKFTSFPPGPICNPGIKSIAAALSPVPTDYWFYLSDNNGITHFARTLEEHNLNIKRYLVDK